MAIYLANGSKLPEDAIGKLVITMEYIKSNPAPGQFVMGTRAIVTRYYIGYDAAVEFADSFRAANKSLNLTANWTMEHVNIF
jgi:hypothetical protein